MGAMKPYPVTPHRAHGALLPRRSGPRPHPRQAQSQIAQARHQTPDATLNGDPPCRSTRTKAVSWNARMRCTPPAQRPLPTYALPLMTPCVHESPTRIQTAPSDRLCLPHSVPRKKNRIAMEVTDRSRPRDKSDTKRHRISKNRRSASPSAAPCQRQSVSPIADRSMRIPLGRIGTRCAYIPLHVRCRTAAEGPKQLGPHGT